MPTCSARLDGDAYRMKPRKLVPLRKRQRYAWWILVILAFCCFKIYCWRRLYTDGVTTQAQRQHSRTVAARVPAYTLNSTAKFQEVRVPFALRNNHIYVQCWLAGTRSECLLDTGVLTTFWPDRLPISCSATGRHTTSSGADGNQVISSVVRLDSLRIGDYTLFQAPGETYPELRGSTANRLTKAKYRKPVLGISAFDQVVLTIDYPNQELIFRNSDYDITHQAHGPNAGLFDLIGTPPISSEPTAWPIPLLINGQIAGKKVQIQLDTGFSGALGITQSLARKLRLKRLQAVKAQGAFGHSFEMFFTNSVDFEIGFIKGTLYTLVLPDVPNQTEVLLGNDILKYFTVTIDYGRRKVLLEFKR